MRRRSKVWIVLADGTGARILQHRTWEPGRFDELAREPADGTPGRAFDGAAFVDPLAGWRPGAEAEVRPGFEHGIADLVNRAAAQGLFDALVIVAPSPTLGILRRVLGPAAGERLIREEAKDFLGLPEQALPARLTALLRR